MIRKRRICVAVALAIVTALIVPAAASAHGLIGRQDLPIPQWLFGWAAAIVLVVSFVALASLWTTPQLQDGHARPLFRMPRWVDPLCGTIGVFVFGLSVYAGFAGTQIPTNNLIDTMVYVIFWVGFVAVNALFGDVFKAFNPWRAIARFVAWVARWATVGQTPEPLPYPRWLGRWPAAIGIFAFAWVELIYVNKQDPSTLSILVLAYAAAQLVGMSLYGIDAWNDRGDAFANYFGMFARLSAFARRGDQVVLRRPLSGVTGLDLVPGTIPLLVTMIGSTSFDGFSQGSAWAGLNGTSGLEPWIQRRLHFLGLGPTALSEVAFTIGLIGCILAVAGFYRLGVAGMRTVGAAYSANDLARRFAHTLVPISLAYVGAHYASLLIFQGQAAVFLASDPFGHGSNLFGTAHDQVSYFLGANAIWYIQVIALVSGHVAGITLAHDRALVLYRTGRDAMRSQLWMLTVMVGFTSLGLWLLSEASK
jgi:hypothetical protein